MRCFLIRALPCILILSAAPAWAGAPYIEDAFSPQQGATQLITKTIGAAKKSVRMAGYYLTSYAILDALSDAQNRGVKVSIVLDKSQLKEEADVTKKLRGRGIGVRINENYEIMHDKFLVIDDVTVQTGSFNYTYAAEKYNAENVIVIHDDARLAGDYIKQWNKLWQEAHE